MITDLFYLDRHYDAGTDTWSYTERDGTIVDKAYARYIIEKNIHKIDIHKESKTSLFISIGDGTGTEFTDFMRLVAIVFPTIDQSYYNSLWECCECTYVDDDDDGKVSKKKIKEIINNIKDML